MNETFYIGLLNSLLSGLFAWEWVRFRLLSSRMEQVQRRYLLNLLKKNKATRFGKKYGFGKIRDVAAFQRQVPVSVYEDYLEDLADMQHGTKNVLTTSALRGYAYSSGTSSASKRIPNTARLLSEMNRFISVWLFDLYQKHPGLLNGKSFWIISPSGNGMTDGGEASESVEAAKIFRPTETAKPVQPSQPDFEDDSAYFHPIKRWLIRRLFVVPDLVPKLLHGENYYFTLGVFLLAEPNLRMISVWNPSVLLLLMDKIWKHRDKIIDSIATGSLLLPETCPDQHVRLLENLLKANPKRADKLHQLLSEPALEKTFGPTIWPNLTLISAWDSVWASIPARELQHRFPQSVIQGKGLLATEACITFPAYFSDPGYRYYPAYTCHFFEFIDTETQHIHLLHDLEPGKTYEVLVTTGGGFYRYRLNDLVRCSGKAHHLPVLDFIGKSDSVSDLTGEKLHETHVRQVVDQALSQLDASAELYFMAPEQTGNAFHYVLFCFMPSACDHKRLQEAVEAGLQENFHYRHSRSLHQLDACEVVLLDTTIINSFYSMLADGSRFGTLKAICLRKELDWKRRF